MAETDLRGRRHRRKNGKTRPRVVTNANLCEGFGPELINNMLGKEAFCPDIIASLPVSYTHLRAHETDSYLVCRLLLEKK